MRKGKRYFGKGNAPLHILRNHLAVVSKRNEECLSSDDKYDGPPEVYKENPQNGENGGQVNEESETGKLFCICRRPESGLMVECEVCHEW
jgi:[histone H3]-trimethyl-L-lysine4 demethylase